MAQQFTSGFSDAFAQFASGAETAKQAFGSFVDDLFAQALRILANKALESILGSFFDPTGGAGSATFNALGGVSHIAFGGGRAGGGPVAAGGLYQVNENGPEMLAVGGRQFLMMGPQGGVVTPTKSQGAGGATINIAVQPTSTRQTAQQVAKAVAREQQLAVARS